MLTRIGSLCNLEITCNLLLFGSDELDLDTNQENI